MSSTAGENRVPMTLRDFFFTDPFFQNSWDDFDKLRREMLRESRDFWSSVEKDMRQMESSFSSMMSSSSSSSSRSLQQSSSSKQESLENKGASTAVVPSDDYSPWFFPRRWMLPRLFGAEDEGRMKSLDLFQHKDDQVIRVRNDDGKFEVSLDMHSFRPDEIKVNVRDRLITVEARHEEREEGRYESRHFSRSYSLPPGCEAGKVQSNLSSDGVLVVTAPKKAALKSDKGTTPIAVEHK